MTDEDYVNRTIKEAVLSKARRYVDDPSEAPEDVEVQEGPQGGYYYETEAAGGGGGEESGEDDSDSPIEFDIMDPESFSQGVSDMIEENPEMGAFLTAHPPEELEDHTLISTADGGAGVAVSPDGDIQNLYNLDGPDGAGRALLEKAIEEGGRTLDCYDGYLRDLYSEYGFRESGRIEFDPEYAPDGWNFEEYGEPDVVFMSYNPEQPAEESDKYYEAQEWEQAKDDSRRRADFGEGSGEEGTGVGDGAQGADLSASASDGRNLTTEDIAKRLIEAVEDEL